MIENIPTVINNISNQAYCANAHHTAAAIAVHTHVAVEYKLRSKLSCFLSSARVHIQSRVG